MTRRTLNRRQRAKRLPAGVPNPIDVHAGSRLRQRRTLLGFSQEKLADAVGLTFQQVQKYERGANRMGASRLFQFSQVLDVPIGYFFGDMPAILKTPEGQVKAGMTTTKDPLPKDPMARRETLELVRAYYKIPTPRVRKRIFELVKATASVGAAA